MKNFFSVFCAEGWDLVMAIPHWGEHESAKLLSLKQGNQFGYEAAPPGEFIQVGWIRS